MTDQSRAISRLDSTLTALERLLLESRDSDLEVYAGDSSLADVRRLVARSLGGGALGAGGANTTGRRSRSQRYKGRMRIADRIAALRRISAQRPDVPLQLRAMLSARKLPSRLQLDALTKELIRLGVLSADDKEDE